MIHNRVWWFGLVVILTLGFFAGCSKPASPPPAPSQSLAAPALRLHWLGKTQLASDPTATNLMAIWNLPESAKLEAQTLDKLATAPWRLWQTNLTVSNAPTALLRPLLADLVSAESYLEVQGASNQPTELVLALRLSPDRAALWMSNLPPVLTALSSTAPDPKSEPRDPRPESSDFTLRTSHFTLQLSRSNSWTLLSVTFASPSTPLRPPTSDLVSVFHSRLAASQTPFPPRTTNYIIEAEVDIPRLNAAFDLGWELPAAARAAKLLVFGDGETLRLRGGVDFSNPLALTLPPWNVPTNLIFAPLIGFSALRGVAPWLEASAWWKEKNLGPAPDQFFFWSQKSAPWLHFFAARSSVAERQFLALKDYILDTVNPALAPNRTGDFAWLTNEARVVWKGVPFCSPAFALQRDVILGGFVTLPLLGRPMPVEYLQQLQHGTNLVYYDWEQTEFQVPSWTQISQLMRMAFSRAQLSIKDAGLPWLNTVGTNLSHTVTTVTLENDHHLTFARAGTLGMNSTELQLFVDWLDSPAFPLGLHTFAAPREFVSDRTRPRR